MAKKSKLLGALNAHKGRDFDAEKRKKQIKSAEKRKRKHAEENAHNLEDDLEKIDCECKSQPLVVADAKNNQENVNHQQDGDFSGFSASDEEDESGDVRRKSPSPSGSVSSASSIPLSEVSSTHSDTVPHHRLTINNSAALTTSTKRIRLSHPHPQTPFSKTHCLISPLNPNVPDPHDDLTRELEFYKICASAATKARHILLHETDPPTPFSRPSDYFAEMVKSDSHMQKIQDKMRREAVEKKAAAEARRQRDLKKFGKAVQVAKEQERAKEKRQTLEKIKDLKRKRRGNNTGLVRETEEDLFDVGVEDDEGKGVAKSQFKRQKRDAKFGFGGKKRFKKSGTAESTADVRGFTSAKKMKEGGGPRVGKTKRLGKSRRAKAR